MCVCVRIRKRYSPINTPLLLGSAAEVLSPDPVQSISATAT